MSKYNFSDYVVSLNAGLQRQLQEDCDLGHIPQSQVDDANFFEVESMNLDAVDLYELMEKAFQAGQKAAG